MDHDESRASAEFNGEVAVGYGVERVFAHAVKTELARHARTVDRKRSSGECGGAKRHPVHAPAAVGEARAVALEHLEIRQQVVTESNRLGDLQMSKARHDGGRVFFRPVEQPAL